MSDAEITVFVHYRSILVSVVEGGCTVFGVLAVR